MLCLAGIYRRNHVLKIIRCESVRVANPWLFRCSTSCGSGSGSAPKGRHQITYKPYVAPSVLSHDYKNMALRRPMSPHLTIYTPTLPAMTSILERITGVILSIYGVLLAGGTLFLTNGVETYVSVIQSLDLSRPSAFIIKIILGAPFAYHYCNGIRFCAWNANRWLSLKEVYSTAHKSWIGAAVIIFLFALL